MTTEKTEVKTKKPRAPRKNTKTKSPTTQEKVLDLSVIREEYDKTTEYSTYVADTKDNLVIKYNEVFDALEIQNLITEVYEHLLENEKLQLGYFNNYAEFMAYVNFMIIKKFTSLKEQLANSTLPQNILIMNELTRVKYFKMYFENVFDPEQVVRVYEAINERAEINDYVKTVADDMYANWDEVVADPSVRKKVGLKN